MNETHEMIREEMFGSDMNSRYYSRLASNYHVRDQYSKIFLALMSSGSVAGWVIWNDSDTFPKLVITWKILSGIAAAVSVILPFLNYSKRVEWASTLKNAFSSAMKDYELLWIRRNSFPDDVLIDKIEEISKKEASLSSIEARFPHINHRLLKRCQNEVIQSRGLK